MCYKGVLVLYFYCNFMIDLISDIIILNSFVWMLDCSVSFCYFYWRFAFIDFTYYFAVVCSRNYCWALMYFCFFFLQDEQLGGREALIGWHWHSKFLLQVAKALRLADVCHSGSFSCLFHPAIFVL